MKAAHWVVTTVVCVLLIWAALTVDWRSAAAIVTTASPAWLIAAIVVNLVSLAIAGARSWLFLRAVGAISLPLAIRGAAVGAGLNNLLVANGGDAARALFVARASGTSVGPVFAALALDRIFDPICFTLLLFCATFTIRLPPPFSAARPLAAAGLVIATLVVIVLVRAPERAVDAASTQATGWRAWRTRMRAFRAHVQRLSTAPRFVVGLAMTLSVWALQITTFSLAARSVGVAVPAAGSVVALLLTNAGLMLRATPGNVGYFQFAYVFAVSGFAISRERGVAAAVLIQLVQIVPVTLLAVSLAPTLTWRRMD